MIELDHISVDFSRAKQQVTRAVDDVSLRIGKGEVYGIVGASGAGKSTLLRVINMLQRPSAGTVNVNGVRMDVLRGADLRRQRQSIGMIFQHFNLMHTRTVASNVAFSLRAAGKSSTEIARRVPEILSMVGLEEKARALPAQLSGGQKQRVGIARAIANQPAVLLCDEPTSALDLETSSSILDLLKEINSRLGITLVLISHEMTVIKSVCDRVAVMTGGKVVEEGDVFDVFATPRHDFTRQLVSHTFNLELPPRLMRDLRGTLLKITFVGASAEQPVLSEVAIRFGVSVNILHGKIEYINHRALGLLVALLTHPDRPEQVAAAVAYIRQNTAQTEVLHG
ncbi:methionine ABC transporter ATP-binding protein [Martelella alba]|uniref:Methionine ABC transporter ATP-binding protein n=1 Tax=Martelella alba TaxID=2590451 RepID=A0ABY2SNQ8_9HYPH|nr:methionine ABC transporter ATP-binding protein [Martelella alba]TKI07448.1 methionine ABC transporter ATP-binding protein [Martelella alba]